MSDHFQVLVILGFALWFAFKCLPDFEAAYCDDSNSLVSATTADATFEFEAESEEEAEKIAAAITANLQGLVDDGTAESVKVRLHRKPEDDDDLSDACEMHSLL